MVCVVCLTLYSGVPPVLSLSQSSCSQSACPTSSPLPSRCPGQTPNLVWLGLVRGRPFSSPAQALYLSGWHQVAWVEDHARGPCNRTSYERHV